MNRSLTLENIKCYGFDMDYTLAGECFYSAFGTSCQTMCEVLLSHQLSCFQQCISLQSMRVWALSCSGTGWCQSDIHMSCWAILTTPPSPHGKRCPINGSGLGYIGSVSSWERLLRVSVWRCNQNIDCVYMHIIFLISVFWLRPLEFTLRHRTLLFH